LGVFPAIYLSGDYDWVLTDKNGVQKNTGSVSEFATTANSAFIKNFETLALAVASTSLQDGDVIVTGDRDGATFNVVLSSSVTEDTFSIVQCTGVATLSLVLDPKSRLTPKKIGAVGDGDADDILALRAFAAYSKANNLIMYGGGPDCFYRISGEFVITHDQPFYGEMCQIFQETANTNVITWDKGLGSGANNQNSLIIKEIVIASVAGTGNGYTFRNINESHISDLFVVGIGNTSFQVEGSLLTEFEHIYSGDGLSLSPGFFTGDYDSGCVNGIVHASYNGLGPNKCTYIRPSITNASGVGIDVATGTGCTFMNLTLEGISTPAVHMKIDRKTTIINGDLEGNGDGILITADNCVIIGMNNLSFLTVGAGVKGTYVSGGTHKFPGFVAGSSNNTFENFEIGVGGNIIGAGAGTNNTIKNITDPGNYEDTIATASQTVFRTTTNYVTGGYDISVYVQDLGAGAFNLIDPADYTETNESTVTFAVGLTATDVVRIFIPEIGQYRTGTFRPLIEFGGASVGLTYSQQIGTYFVQGDRVDFKVRVQINAIGSSTGTMTIDLNDLPFTTANDSCDTIVNVHHSGIALGAGYALGNRLDANGKIINLYKVLDTTGVNTALANTDFSTGDQIWVTGYFHQNL